MKQIIVESLFIQMMRELEFDNSEGATEEFVDFLEQACKVTIKEIRHSHKEGLSLYTLGLLSRYMASRPVNYHKDGPAK